MTPGPPGPRDSHGLQPRLVEVLTRARHLGFLGPVAVTQQAAHARVFSAAVAEPPRRAVDLGPGGGLPGLVLALTWPESEWWFIEASTRRATFLAQALWDLEVDHRVEVLPERAETVAARPERRGLADLVVARSFAAPAVTAELGSPFLAVGGLLVVSEPPEPRPQRWAGVASSGLGLVLGPRVRTDEGHVQVLRQETQCPRDFPRSPGRLARRPLF